MAIRDGKFYAPWPVLQGKPLNLQWGEIRSNQAELKAIARSSVQELETGVDELNAFRTLLGTMYGDIDFRNKFRFFYNQDTTEMTCQKNDGTVAVPSWTDVWQIRFSDGQFQVVSIGGIQSSAGFYGPGLQTIEEVAESSSSADKSIRNPSKIFFNSDDGFGVQEISSGANKGQPEIVFTQPFGQAQSFSKSGKEWKVDHNYGLKPVLVQVMDADDRVVIPDKADVSDPNTAYFYFNSVFTGTVYIASGGVGAASLVPRDPFYLVVRTQNEPASPNNTLKPNADLIFDANDFYVNVDLDSVAGGAHKKAIISLIEGNGVTFTDGSNTYTAATHLNVNENRFYLSSDADGNPVLNSQFQDRVDFEAHVRMDDTLDVENGVTAEAFYLEAGGEIYKSGDNVHIGAADGKLVSDDVFCFQNGTVGAPGISFESDATTGLFKSGSNLAISAGGASATVFTGAFNLHAFPQLVPDGSAASPALQFTLDQNSGIYRVGTDIVGVSAGGVETARFGSTLSKFATHVRIDDSLNVENAVTAEAFYLAPGSGGEISKSGNDVLIKSDSGQVVIDDSLLVSDKLVAEAFYTTVGGSVNPLRIREQDGTPNVQNIKDIIVGNGALTDNGNGTVTLATGTGGGINIKDENNIYLGPDNLIFRNANFYLTSDSNSDPVVNLQPGGGLDHGDLTGRSDDDHTQYAHLTQRQNTFTNLVSAEAFYVNVGGTNIGPDYSQFGNHVRMDDTLEVENAVTAEAFYVNVGGTNIGPDYSQFGNHVRMDDTLEVENAVTAEAFYVTSGGELSRASKIHLADGSASAPSLSFTNDLDVGLFRYGANMLGFTTDGTRRGYIGKDGWRIEDKVEAEAFYVTSGGELSNESLVYARDGSAAKPSYAFGADKDVGLYRIGANTIGFSVGGSKRMQLNAAGLQLSVPLLANSQTITGLPAGSAGSPAIAWATDTNTGIFKTDTDSLSISCNGVDRFNVNGVFVESNLKHYFVDGAVGAPGIGFGDDTNTGLYRIGDDNIGFATNGTYRVGIANTNTEITTNVSIDQDLTVTGAFKPRTLVQAAEPAAGTGATQVDSGELVVWVDSDGGNTVYLVYNYGGTVTTVAFS